LIEGDRGGRAAVLGDSFPVYKYPGKVLLPDHRNEELLLSAKVLALAATTKQTMASFSSRSKVLALGALIFSLLVTYGSCARPPVNFTASDFTADPNWEAARATWYGAPTGAGPDDDGT
jgi:hypothetical protein